MSLVTQLVLSLLMGIPLGIASIWWATWRLPLGGRIVGDAFLLPYIATLMWCAGHVLRFFGFRGDAACALMMYESAHELWRRRCDCVGESRCHSCTTIAHQ